MKEEHDVKTILTITTEDDKYTFSADEGVSVAELAFVISALIRVLVRDGHIKSNEEFLDLVNRYLTDPQYEEVN